MPMSVRAENALTGHLLLDLFRLCADRRCLARGLPKGSLWLAGQTHKNIQSSALGLLALLVSKDTEGDYWKSGHARLCELPIEEWFGRLRSRSATSQLSCRAYWRSSAKEMLKHIKGGQKIPESDRSEMAAISEDEFYDISKRSLHSAIKLVAWCNNFPEESLRAKYFETDGYKLNAADQDPENLHDWEKDPQDSWEAADTAAPVGSGQTEAPQSACKDFLDQVVDEVAADDEDDAAEAEGSADAKKKEKEQCADPLSWELRNVPDADKLKEVFEAQGEADNPFKSEDAVMQSTMDSGYGSTLSRVLSLCGSQLSLENDGGALFDGLWRLLMYLRHWKGGADKHWLKNPRAARRSARTTHWYKCLGAAYVLDAHGFSR